MRTLPVLIRYSQWNMITADSQANKGEIWRLQLGCDLAAVLSASKWLTQLLSPCRHHINGPINPT